MRRLTFPGARRQGGLLILSWLLILSACSPDSPDPAGPIDPGASADASRQGCAWRGGDCPAATNGRIAYSRYIDYTGFAIFSAKSDGSDVRQLTTPVPGAFDDGSPDWSPDGSTIVFERDFSADGTHQLYRVNADGSGLTALTECTGRCLGVANPVYSPDGTKIAFAEAYGDDAAFTVGIWIMNADGSNLRQITQRGVPDRSEDQWAAWSPDGRRIAFTRYNTLDAPVGKQAIFVSDVDGSHLHRVTPWQLNGAAADWSPGGRLILFTSHYDIEPAGKEQLYTVHPDGTGMTRITPSGFALPSNILGRFSPDGRKIIFVHFTQVASDPTPTSLIYTMNADGSNVALVSFVDDFYYNPAWGTRR